MGKVNVALPISFKKSVEVLNFIRGKDVNKAVRLLNEVLEHKKAIPLKRYVGNKGHKPGMASGAYFDKVTKAILHLLKEAIANSKNKGEDVSKLYVAKAIANKLVSSNKRRKGYGKSTLITIELKEREEK